MDTADFRIRRNHSTRRPPYLGTYLEVSVQKSQMIIWTGHGSAAALLSQRPPVFCVDNAREPLFETTKHLIHTA